MKVEMPTGQGDLDDDETTEAAKSGADCLKGMRCRYPVARIARLRLFMAVSRITRTGFAWLELLLALATLALLFQIFPALWTGMLWALDIRNWPRSVWFAGNLSVVVVLVAIRFVPDLLNEWRERRERLAIEREKKCELKKLKEQRETIERIQQARSRRFY